MSLGDWLLAIGIAIGGGGIYATIQLLPGHLAYRRRRRERIAEVQGVRERGHDQLAAALARIEALATAVVVAHDPREPGHPAPVPEVGMRVYVVDTGQTLEYTGEPEPWREVPG